MSIFTPYLFSERVTKDFLCMPIFLWISHNIYTGKIYLTYNSLFTHLLLLLSHFSHVWLCDPIDSSSPGSSVPGFSRQEYWSGLLFPSPYYTSLGGYFLWGVQCNIYLIFVHKYNSHTNKYGVPFCNTLAQVLNRVCWLLEKYTFPCIADDRTVLNRFT